jgi:4-amino-4-deoxy-L-arabinose transferase-like glycosyltransferase
MERNTRLSRGWTMSILLVGLLLRLLVLRSVLRNYPPGWLFTRGMEMGLLAKSLLAGQGLGSPFGVPTGPTAFIAPGYPLLIAGVFRILGVDSVASAVAIICLQIALNLVTIWLMMRISRRLFDQTAANIAGLIWACSFPLIWMPTIFWDTSLAICLLTGLVAFAVDFRGRLTAGLWIALGAGSGVTALINPAMLPAIGAIVLWLAWQQPAHRVRGLVLAGVTGLLVFSPWPIRNARVFHAFIPLRTTVGFELWMGNRPGATGFLDESLFPSFNKTELNDYKTRGELGYTAHKSELAKEFIRSHPGTFLRLTGLRVMRYWTGTGSEKGSMVFALHAIVTSVFGLTGLALLFRQRRYALGILFALPLLLFPAPYYITLPSSATGWGWIRCSVC